MCPLRDKWAVDGELTEIAAVCEACGIACVFVRMLDSECAPRWGCVHVLKRERNGERQSEFLFVVYVGSAYVCVWDVNCGEVHWASELVQSVFWHARAVHMNFVGSRWHDSPHGLAATASTRVRVRLWAYLQILLSLRPVMLHALTRINSAVWFPSNPGRRAASGLFTPLSLFRLCIQRVLLDRVSAVLLVVWHFRGWIFALSDPFVCTPISLAGFELLRGTQRTSSYPPDLSTQIYARRLSAKKTFHLCQARHFVFPEALTLFADISTVLCRCIVQQSSFFK